MIEDKISIKDATKPLLVNLTFPVNTYYINVAGHLNNIVYVRWLDILMQYGNFLRMVPKQKNQFR